MPTPTDAPLKLRCKAALLDFAVAGLPCWVALAIVPVLLGGSGAQRFGALFLIPVALGLSALAHLGHNLLAAALDRPTLGQRRAGIQVAGTRGRRLVLRELVGRLCFWCLALLAPPLLLLDSAWCLVDARGRSARDLLSGTHLALQPVEEVDAERALA